LVLWGKCSPGISKTLQLFLLFARLISKESWREVLAIKIAEHLHSQDELDVHALFEKWAKAVRDGNWSEVRADHDPEILMFDVPPPFLSRGIEAYMATWEKFVLWSDKPVAFDFHDVSVTAGKEVAFVTAIGQCAGTYPNETHEALEFRLTMGLRKINGRWRIMHEHHSVPAE
jgi:ketosteroid isomerase-like protein